VNFLRYLTERLKERSTWAGFIVIIGGIGLKIDPALWQDIVTAGCAAAGLLYALTSDPKTTVVLPPAAFRVDTKTQLADAIAKGDYAQAAILAAELAKQ